MMKVRLGWLYYFENYKPNIEIFFEPVYVSNFTFLLLQIKYRYQYFSIGTFHSLVLHHLLFLGNWKIKNAIFRVPIGLTSKLLAYVVERVIKYVGISQQIAYKCSMLMLNFIEYLQCWSCAEYSRPTSHSNGIHLTVSRGLSWILMIFLNLFMTNFATSVTSMKEAKKHWILFKKKTHIDFVNTVKLQKWNYEHVSYGSVLMKNESWGQESCSECLFWRKSSLCLLFVREFCQSTLLSSYWIEMKSY